MKWGGIVAEAAANLMCMLLLGIADSIIADCTKRSPCVRAVNSDIWSDLKMVTTRRALAGPRMWELDDQYDL